MDFRSPSAGNRRRGIFFIVGAASVLLLLLVALIVYARRSTPGGFLAIPGGPQAPSLADLGWITTSEGDFEHHSVEVAGSRLRLRASTARTRPSTVKFMGVRRREEIALKPGTRVSVDLDWNRQENGSGLSAGIVLAPAATEGNPFQLASCVWVEFKGVPPGRRARRVIGRRHDFAHHHLDMEGWPDRNKEGRAIGVQKLQIEIGEGGSFRVMENGALVYESGPGVLTFDRAYVYLQMSSNPGYAAREVYFGNVEIPTAPR